MATLFLNKDESRDLEVALAKMEREFGTDYSFEPEEKAFSCKCSGPAQSCTWH